ncbi:WD repeat-containing protein 63 isoform X2 [Oryzias melastigma]|uniref:WD repeat-containing protein 63 isoform X2 n=1 Tax=Oryzias melastigma TaxID=30732 RepID=UPI000CF7E101|nr:WD repeat-containing protein 63 isoform X2 [Oryzias melastigma]
MRMAPKRQRRSKSASRRKEKGQPPGVHPLALTSATQELFECRADEDVTRESPYKLLRKYAIIQDIKTRAAVSDFSPMEQIVLDYAEEEILLVFDKDSTYGQNFYLDLTAEAKHRLTKPQDSELFEDEMRRTPEPKKSTSLITEKEIEQESVKEREKLRLKFSRVQVEIGTTVTLSDYNVADSKHNYVEFPSYQDNRSFIRVMQRDCGIQAVSRLRSDATQTAWKLKKNDFTQYSPRELSQEEKEAILQSESLKNFTMSVTPRVLLALQQQEIADVFVDDFEALGSAAEAGDLPGQTSDLLVLHQGFTDKMHTKDRKISSINWHPTIPGVIAVALTTKKGEELMESAVFGSQPSFIVFYSFSFPTNSQLLLRSPGDILCFEFCPSNPNIIAGGCINGQVVLWDISAYVTCLQGSQPSGTHSSDNKETFNFDEKKVGTPTVDFCAMSDVKATHKARITDIHWLLPSVQVSVAGVPVENTSNISVQIVTCGLDGTIMFWDLRVPTMPEQLLAGTMQDQKTTGTSWSVPQPFTHLRSTWRPLFKIDFSGEHVPVKFSMDLCTCQRNTVKEFSETLPDYSQLRIPPANEMKVLEDVNTKFYTGTEDGEIIYSDWKLGKDESGQQYSPKPLFCVGAHLMMVNTVQRSPFFQDIILTTGPLHFAIWKDGVTEGPLVKSQWSGDECTVGCWSLSRPAVFFIGKANGCLEVWNLLESSIKPVHVQTHVTSSRITCLKPWAVSLKKHFLAVTNDLGVLRIFEILRTLYHPSKNEISRMEKYFDMEKNYLKFWREKEKLWSKEKKVAEEPKQKKVEPSRSAKSVCTAEEEELKRYNDFKMLEESILKEIGLW